MVTWQLALFVDPFYSVTTLVVCLVYTPLHYSSLHRYKLLITCMAILLSYPDYQSVLVSLSCVVGGMLSERVGSMHPRMHYVSVSLVQNAVCTCCAYVGKCEKGFV